MESGKRSTIASAAPQPQSWSLHRLATAFIEQHLHANPDTEVIHVHCQGDRGHVFEAQALEAAAEACVNEFQQRVEITEPAQSPVILRRVCHRREPAFLAGTTSAGKLLWTHSRNLALILDHEGAPKVVQALEAQGIRVSMEPLTRAQAQICAAELSDLEHEAKRSLSQDQAQRYRLRRLKAELIANLLERR